MADREILQKMLVTEIEVNLDYIGLKLLEIQRDSEEELTKGRIKDALTKLERARDKLKEVV